MTIAYGIDGILDWVSILLKMYIALNIRSNLSTGFTLYQIIFLKIPELDKIL